MLKKSTIRLLERMANAGFTSVDEALGELQCLHMQLVERNAEIERLRTEVEELNRLLPSSRPRPSA
jgi:hypothetical protein